MIKTLLLIAAIQAVITVIGLAAIRCVFGPDPSRSGRAGERRRGIV